MKKLLYTIASLAALTAIACTKEQGTPEVRPEIPDTPEEVIEVPATLSGSMGDPTTKVSNDNNGAYKWQASDHVTILTNNGANREFSADEAGLTTEFSGHIPNTDALVGGFALYPASSDLEAAHHSISGTTITFNIPTTLTWGADASYMPMYAPIGEDPEDAQKVKASFKAVGGAMKLICYNIPAGATTLAFTAKVNIAGNFTLDTNAGTPTLSGEGSGKEIDIDFTGNYSANKVFYIPLPPVTLTGGFTISFFDSGANELFSTTTSAAPAIGRNHLVIAPALDCDPAPADDTLSNSDITDSDLSGSYANVTITSATGKTWNVNALKSNSRIQLKKDVTTSYIQLPAYGADISSVVLNGVYNGSGTAFSGTIKLLTELTDGEEIASETLSISAGEDVSISVPAGYETGYILCQSSALQITSITVKFRGADIPAITVGSDALTINVGSSNASTTASLANAVDGLGINWKFSGTNADKFEASLDGTTLTVTAKETNSSASDYTAILTLKASGAVSKEIAITQKTKLVPNPAVTVTPGDSKFTATWTADENATSYVAYLHTAQTATPATGGTDITSSISNSGSAYSITDYPVTNGTTYYLYVKVNGVSSGYSAPSDYVEYSFKAALWDLKSIAVTTAPKTTYTAGECFDPTGMVVTATFENHDNTEQTKQETVDNANLTFEPSTSTALTTSDESVSISYTVSGITKGTTQAITVNPDTSDHYQKVTSLSNVTAGEYIIVNDGYCLPNADATNAGPVKLAVTINNNEVQSVTSAMTWTFTGTTSAMTIQSTADDTKYLYVAGTSNNNQVRVNTTSHTWTIADYSGTSGAFTMKDNSNNRYCASYGDGDDWRSYNSYSASNYGDGGRVYLYKLVDNTVWDLKSIAVTTPPTKTAYEAGEFFDPDGMVVTATYEDHAHVKVDKTEAIAHGDLTFSPALDAALTAGTTSVSITYSGQSTSQAITVTAPVVWDLKSIAVTTAPTKTTYTEGEFFDPTGLVVTPTFEEHGNTSNTKVGDPVDNANLTFTPSTSTALTTSDESVSISYTVSGITKGTTQAITVNAASSEYYELISTVAELETGDYVIAGKTNSTYYAMPFISTGKISGTAVSVTEGKISATTGDNYAIAITKNNTGQVAIGSGTTYLQIQTSGTDLGTTTTANYYPVSVTNGAFDISNTRHLAWRNTSNVFGNYANIFTSEYDGVYLFKKTDNTVWDLKSIAVTTPPTKTTYDVGDNFDPTGMVVTATYEDHAGVKADKEETVAHGDLTFSPALNAALTAGTTSVSISYGGQSTSQAITVIEWTLNSIAVKTAPTKVSYTAGQNFDPAGLVITATYTAAGQSNKNVDIAYSNETAAAFIFSPTTSTALTTDHSSVSITWGGKTTSQAITVNEAGGSTPLTNPANVKVTAITRSSFTATWSNDANASSYEWMLSTSSTAPASTSDSSVKAYGTSSVATLSSNTWTLNKTSITPALDGKYYFYVKAIGSGSFSDSEYSSAAKVILTLDFSSNIFSLSTSGNDASSETSKAYNNYTYKLYATNSCYWYSSSALFLGKSGSYLTVPAISGVKLTSVTAGNRTGASSKVTVAIVPTNNTTATTGGSASTITPGSSKTWNLTATSENTAYRLYVNNANNVQFTTITLIYTD